MQTAVKQGLDFSDEDYEMVNVDPEQVDTSVKFEDECVMVGPEKRLKIGSLCVLVALIVIGFYPELLFQILFKMMVVLGTFMIATYAIADLLKIDPIPSDIKPNKVKTILVAHVKEVVKEIFFTKFGK